MSTNIVVIFVHQYVKFLTILLTFLFYHMGLFKDFCEGSVCMRNNVHSHLHHTKQPMAIFGGDGCLSNGRFLWKKWEFCSEVKKIINVEIKCKRQFIYRLYQHLASFTNIIITNANVNIYIKLIAFQGLIFLRIMN